MTSSGKLTGGNSNDTPKFVARYIENFIDLVENVPNDLSRRITQVHEFQLDYETSLAKLESNLTRFSRPQTNSDGTTNDLKQLKLLLATQHYLARMQDISDNKLTIVQDALDQLDTKSRELDYDFKLINASTSEGNEQATSNSKNSKKDATGSKNQGAAAASSATTSQPRGSGSSASHNHRGESPEPTYCVCHQVSYGDMICCDNDACDIEWFHFQCVSLTSKPKGKWYCPNCRGDRSNQLKK